MPEANVLYGVTAAVVIGLIVWVLLVLKTAKEPWARDVVPTEGARAAAAEAESSAPPSSADVTAESTPVIVAKPGDDLGEAKAEAAEVAEAEVAEAESAEAEARTKTTDDAS
jgi:hypothetical protein